MPTNTVHQDAFSRLGESASSTKRSLVVGAGPGQFAAVRQLLASLEFEVDSLRGAEDALLLAQHVLFDLLLVRYPLPGMEPQTFFEAVRQATSACRGSAMFILAEDEFVDDAKLYIGRGVSKVVPISDPCGDIESAIASGLRAAPRLASRLTAMLEAETGVGAERLMCQIANISNTGMLVGAARKYNQGTKIHFSISLPGKGPGTGTAEVVRHTFGGRERVDGFGVRFLDLDGDMASRLADYLRSRAECYRGT